MRKTSALAVMLFLGFLLASCEHESEQVNGTTKVCFPSEVLPPIKSNCAMSGCHTGNGELLALNNYNDILRIVTPGKPSKSKLHKVLTANPHSGRFMPPNSSGLAKKYIDYISLWILQGAKDLDTSNVTFAANVQPIIDTYCRSCHSGAEPSGGISLIDYASTKACVESDRFMGTIEHLTDYSPMPKGKDKLCDCNIAEIIKWINNGMPNN